MVTGAITYEELHAKAPRALERMVELMSQHPDRGSFEVALGRANGEARTRKLLMEMARWPDDIRKSSYDHPTWHYASRPLIDSRHPPAADIRDGSAGSAVEAFALNLSVAKDARAPAAERAIALCWILHLVGDIHQPLHAADQYSAGYPDGDHGGGLKYILDPQTHQPMSLHWYWDQAVNRSSDTAPSRATELAAKFPPPTFTQLAKGGKGVEDFSGWAAESYALARSEAYRADLTSASSESQAPALAAAYVANSSLVAERQLTLSGYRLAELLMTLFAN